MTANALASQQTKSPAASVQGQSNSMIQAAIHGDHDAGAALKRINAILAMPGYFRANDDEETEMAIREEFVRALEGRPNWAVQRAFDRWVKTATRRPSPGEILILIDRELQPLAEELARRKRAYDARVAAEAEVNANRCSPEAAARILAEHGMTAERLEAVRRFPTERILSNAIGMDEPTCPADWTVGLPDDDPRLVALRKSRAASVAIYHSEAKA